MELAVYTAHGVCWYKHEPSAMLPSSFDHTAAQTQHDSILQ